METLRVGVIGAGAFAESCHIPGLQSHPKAEVVAICGRQYTHARMLADRMNVSGVYTDFLELCARTDIDAVTIVTPNASHDPQAKAALAASKHVFCEKPLAMNVAEASELLCRAEASGKVHQIGFTFRYLYGVQELRRRLGQGDIGEPYYMRIQFDTWDAFHPDSTLGFREKLHLAGGGVLYDLGSHFFDLASFILGPVESVTGFTKLVPRQRIDRTTGIFSDVETDDIASAWFIFANGVHGQWVASRITPSTSERAYVEVIGREGALRASLSRGSVDILRVSRPTAPTWQILPLPEQAADGRPHCLGSMMRSFVDACLRRHLDGNIDASFHDGFTAQLALEAVNVASRQNWILINDCKSGQQHTMNCHSIPVWYRR